MRGIHVRAGDYDAHDCSTVPTTDAYEMTIAPRVLASTNPEEALYTGGRVSANSRMHVQLTYNFKLDTLMKIAHAASKSMCPTSAMQN